MGYSKYDEKEKTLKSLQIKRENNEVKLLFEKYACEFPCSRPETKKLLSKYEWNIDRTGVNLSYSMPLLLTPEPEVIEIEKSLKEKCQIAITALMSLFDEKDLKLKTWTR
ncbi:MAG: hypothetical protein NZ942_03265 [Candidatus Aenigmarchaeota archaeon]|nr:hypothetical protein [Candidatus Aenigmarchaeota archaeon]